MRRQIDKAKAIKLRLEGYSYSEIKAQLGVSKSTLSSWLENYPLSPERIKELRDNNPRRIENYINTMRLKRKEKFEKALADAEGDIGEIKNRDLFIAGFFLYWAEGGKTASGAVCFANTDPQMIIVFVKWLSLLGVNKEMFKVKLHLYKDMNIEEESKFWRKYLGIKKNLFLNPYIKNSSLSGLTYKNGFGHGTCNIIVRNTELHRYILMGTKYIATVLMEDNKHL